MSASNQDFAERRKTASFHGCLLGGAVGDALGAAVEFLSSAEIRERFGQRGIRDYVLVYGRKGAITDDTQMTMFTAEGLLRGWVRGSIKGICSLESVVANAYLRWLRTQGISSGCEYLDPTVPGWLIGETSLYERRAPGITCLTALRGMRRLGDKAVNDSKGCGGVMRVAPAGLYYAQAGQVPPWHSAFELGCDLAALTHGHPTGQLSAGVFATVIAGLASGETLPESLEAAETCLESKPSHLETLQAIRAARELAAQHAEPAMAIPRLGQGWIAEEALAIALYCALAAPNFEEAIVWSVNHGGDSDSTGSLTGNLLGARDGIDAIPQRWLDGLEFRDSIEQLATDLDEFASWDLSDDNSSSETDRIWRRYPGY